MVGNSNKVAICIAGVLDSLPDVVRNFNTNFLNVVDGDVFVYAPRSNSSSSTIVLDAVSKLKGVVDVRIEHEDVSEAIRAEGIRTSCQQVNACRFQTHSLSMSRGIRA